MKKLPQSRSENIVVQSADKELLLYDLIINKAYCLNETSALIYQACDGKTTFAELKKRERKLTDEIIFLAIDEMQKENLLQEKFESGISRRKLLTEAAFAALTLPMITILIAPKAVQAQSCLQRGATCTSSGQCCPEFCQFEPGTNIIACINGTCRQIQGCPV